ncbi:hypothetical protein [Nocardia sp. NBC_01009]|uniref:hypothetical protein n=1 Tax=Nocardia sp. NBC_01009 TaxID=2975996 RepID=UPI003866AA86|nr:hypothetical protein OHA42_25575 [Nocardia sp. NBC_01009]
MTTVDIAAPHSVCDQEVAIPVGAVELAAHLRIPDHPIGIVVFAHGSGSNRHNPRNTFVVEVFAGHRLGMLSIDLLTSAEAIDDAKVFDVGLLGSRLAIARRCLRSSPICRELPVGYFGAGSEAPAALWAAAEPRDNIRAVVVRGARPDLAGARLGNVMAPTLFVLGGLDIRVHTVNRRAAAAMRCEHRVTVLAGHGLGSADPQTSQRAAYVAAMWFAEQLRAHRGPAAGPTQYRDVDESVG